MVLLDWCFFFGGMEIVCKQTEYDIVELMFVFLDLGFIVTKMEFESFDFGEYCFGLECFPKSKINCNFKNPERQKNLLELTIPKFFWVNDYTFLLLSFKDLQKDASTVVPI